MTRVSVTRAIDVACPHCRSGSGKACIDLGHRNGILYGRFHFARVQAARAKTIAANDAARSAS